jgi:N-succinyldiaminopimelate aminotransferase
MRPYETSVFGTMSARAARLGAVNLGQGFPDTDGPLAIRQAAERAIEDGRGNQYPPAHGLPQLRAAVAAHQRRFYDLDVDPDLGVVVGTGASEVIGSAVLALVDAGDEVIVLEPYFDIYAAQIALARGVRVPVPLAAREGRFALDADAVRAAVTPRTRLVVLNSPHNPTGTVFTRAELESLAAVAIEHDLVVLSDEVYEHLVFDGATHVPLASLPGMADRTVTVGSAGKSFSLTGWKVGWGTGPADLIGAVRTVRQHLSFVSGGPFQWAIAEALELPDTYFRDFASSMQDQRDLLVDGLVRLGLPTRRAEGTYFALSDVSPLGLSGREFCDRLPEEVGVAAIPVEVFCDTPDVGQRFVRWAFCKRPEVLVEALDRLAAGLPRLRPPRTT